MKSTCDEASWRPFRAPRSLGTVFQGLRSFHSLTPGYLSCTPPACETAVSKRLIKGVEKGTEIGGTGSRNARKKVKSGSGTPALFESAVRAGRSPRSGSGTPAPPRVIRHAGRSSRVTLRFLRCLEMAEKVLENRDGARDARSLVKQDVRPCLKARHIAGEYHDKRSAFLAGHRINQVES